MRGCGSGFAAANTTTTWSRFAATTRSPIAPLGARRANADRRGYISAIAQALPRSSRSRRTASPTASLSPSSVSRLSRPRSETSKVSPDAVWTDHTPPVPRTTTPRSDSTTTSDHRIECRLHGEEGHPTDRLPHRGLAHPPHQILGLEVSGDGLVPPPHEQQIGSLRRLRIAGLVDSDVHTVRLAIDALERWRPRVVCDIAAERRLIRRHRCPPTSSRKTFPVMNATLAGRSASRRMRYGYHCVPNGTYTRMLYPSRANDSWRSRRMPYSI